MLPESPTNVNDFAGLIAAVRTGIVDPRLSPVITRCELNALLHNWPDIEVRQATRADAEPGVRLHKLMLETEANAQDVCGSFPRL